MKQFIWIFFALYAPITLGSSEYNLENLVSSCRTLDYPQLKLSINGSVEPYLARLDKMNQNVQDYEILEFRYLNYVLQENANHNWMSIQLPHVLLRKAALFNYSYSSELDFEAPTVNLRDTRTWPAHFAAYDLTSVPEVSVEEKHYWKLWKDNIKLGRGTDEAAFHSFLKYKSLVPLVSCAEYANNPNVSVPHCVSTLKKIINDDAPSYVAIFMEDIMERIMIDRSYRAPVVRAAKKITEMLNDSSLKVTSSFNLLVREFQVEGLSRNQAIDKAMDFFVAHSVIGPDLHMIFIWDYPEHTRILPPKDPTYLLALRTLALVPSILDMRQFAKPGNLKVHSTAIPNNVKMNCQYGKNYYFWQTAYWTWKHARGLKLPVYQNGVIAAVWSLLKGYQKFSDGPFRVPFANLETSWDSVANNQIRRDLSLGMSGMLFVKDLINNDSKIRSTISVDELMLSLINSSQPISIEDYSNKKDEMMKCLKSPQRACLKNAAKIAFEFNRKWEKVINSNKLIRKLSIFR